MRPWTGYIYPLFLASFPALDLAAGNPGEYSLRDLLSIVGVIGLGLLALQVLLHGLALLSGRRAAGRIVPVLVTALVGWCFLYMPVYRRVHGLSGGLMRHWMLVVLGVAVTAGFLAWLSRREHQLKLFNRFMTALAVLLVLFAVARITIVRVRSSHTIARSALVRNLERPLRTVAPAGNTARIHPDIYLILLDMYASSPVLRERYDFDNRAFEDSLRSLGFIVPPGVRSNYNQSRHSLPSILNFAHVTRVANELGTSTDASLSYHLVRNNRLARYLKSQGYRFVFFPSAWWHGTHDTPDADLRFEAWTGLGLKGQLARSDLRRHLTARTPLALLDRSATDLRFATTTLEGLKHMAGDSRPTFAFAHVLLPHPPFVANADCRPMSRELPLDSAEAARVYTQQYLDQLTCTNRLVLDLVTALLKTSSPPPVIVLQGDHGATSLEPLALSPRAPLSGAEARAEFGAFGGYYLPMGGERALRQTITLVNLFRDLLNHYFGLAFPREPDSLYYLTGLKHPNQFLRVSPAQLEAP